MKKATQVMGGLLVSRCKISLCLGRDLSATISVAQTGEANQAKDDQAGRFRSCHGINKQARIERGVLGIGDAKGNRVNTDSVVWPAIAKGDCLMPDPRLACRSGAPYHELGWWAP